MPDQPLTAARPMDELDLEPFCGTNIVRFNTAKPFVKNGMMYATDKALCIRVPAPGAADSEVGPHSSPLPPCEQLPWKSSASADQAWPAAAYSFGLVVVECGECESKSVIFEPTSELQNLDGRTISTIYHATVASLPNVRFVRSDNPTEPIYFRFDGGEGVLMPIAPKRADSED